MQEALFPLGAKIMHTLEVLGTYYFILLPVRTQKCNRKVSRIAVKSRIRCNSESLSLCNSS